MCFSALVTYIRLSTGASQGFQGIVVPLSALGRWKTVFKRKVCSDPNYENWNLAMRSALTDAASQKIIFGTSVAQSELGPPSLNIALGCSNSA